MTGADEVTNRFVRIRCPICNQFSPTVDQQEDVRRQGMSNWWFEHRNRHLPHPIIEAVGALVWPYTSTEGAPGDV